MTRPVRVVVRAVRHRLGWRQADLATRARVSRGAVAKLERHGPMSFTGRTLAQICAPLGVQLRIDAWWHGAELDRLLDAGHAALQAHAKQLLEVSGWIVRVEVTFSHYGERGSVDLLAFHPDLQILLVVEIKTEIVDVQGLLRPLDVKVRLGPELAAAFEWRPALVIPCLVVWDATTARRRITSHASLFDRFEIRGRRAAAWLRGPVGAPRGLLLFAIPSDATGGAVRRTGRQRVRRPGRPPSSRSVRSRSVEAAQAN